MKKLAERARTGDKEAFVQLIGACKQDLYKVARGFFRNDQDIADVIQETILTGYEKISKLRQPQLFKTWLIRILINKCNAFKKTAGRYVSMENMPELGYEDYEQKNKEFSMLMEQLDEKYRLVLILFYAEDLSVEQISELLGISRDAVKTRLKRGRQKAKLFYIDKGAEVIL